MEKPEIIAGLKSATTRGYSLEFSKKSFINAGYSEQDVNDSANALLNGSSSKTISSGIASQNNSDDKTSSSVSVSVPNKSLSQPSMVSQPVKNPSYQPLSSSPVSQTSAYKPLPQAVSSPNDYKRQTDTSGQPKARGLGLVILLVIILIIVLGVLGLFLFKKELVETYLRAWGII